MKTRYAVILAMLAALCAALPSQAVQRPHVPTLPPASEHASVSESLAIQKSEVLPYPGEQITTHPHWRIEKFRNQLDHDIWYAVGAYSGRNPHDPKHEPYGVTEFVGNLLTTVGGTYLWNKASVTGGPPQTMDAAHTRVLSDDSSTAATAGDTGSSATAGSTHQWWQLATSVTQTTSSESIVASFGANDGNFAWQSVGTGVGASATASSAAITAGEILLNHRVVASGTKSNPAVWTVTETLTLGP